MTTNYSINFGLPIRNKRLIKFVIIHYTGIKSESAAIKKLCNIKSKVSAHYYIKNNEAKVINLSKKINWFDAGTLDDYFNVSKKIYDLQKINNIMIGSIHFTSLEMKITKKKNIIDLLKKFKNSQYSSQVIKLIK